VLINEIAWAGTFASAHDEWIELFNPGASSISIDGWLLSDDGDLQVVLQGLIEPYGYFLLERTDESTIMNLPSDMLYTGALNNGGEVLRLTDSSGTLIDSANLDGGAWPAGDAPSRGSMERIGGEDRSGNWRTYTGFGGNGIDAAGAPIQGTPHQPNSIFFATPTVSPVPSPSINPSPPPTAAAAGSVLINEIAWAGTLASSSDEWMELYNPGETSVNLLGWTLLDGGDIRIELEGTISAGGFFLLERTDDLAIANIDADLTYSGSLSNSGETLLLLDGTGNPVDRANPSGGRWPAGDAVTRSSMERAAGGWGTFTGYHGNGIDAGGNPIPGTPRQANSQLFPTPQPTWIPGKLVINEVLIRPHYDWGGTGGVDTRDEFIEIFNLGPGAVNMRGFVLDDIPGGGSSPYELPSTTIEPGEFRSFFRSRTHLALNDGGDTVRLLAPDGRLVDEIGYLRVRAYNLSYGRLPDGSGHMRYGLWPTPGRPNLPFDENPPTPTTMMDCGLTGSSRLPRLARFPGMRSWLRALGFVACGWPPADRAAVLSTTQ